MHPRARVRFRPVLEASLALSVLLLDPAVSHGQAPALGGSGLLVTKGANKEVIRPGELVTWELTVFNASEVDLFERDDGAAGARPGGGIFVRDVLPTGFKYLARTTQLMVYRKGSPTPEVLADADPTGSTVLRFALTSNARPRPFSLGRGEKLVIRYQTVAGLEARPGRSYHNRAQVLSETDAPLSATVEREIRVEEDGFFDQGLLLGKVFCDADGDGWQQPGEPGIAGARVYIDTGAYTESDPAGKLSLSGIAPGNHLVKLDEDTLPPGARLQGRSAAVLLPFSSGLPHKLSWPVQCPPMQLVGRESVELNPRAWAEGLRRIEATAVEVDGRVDPPALVVASQPVSLLTASLSLGKGRQVPEPGSAAGVHLFSAGPGLAELLRFRTAVSGDAAPQSWRLRIFPFAGHDPVREFSGPGAPPAELAWDGTGEDEQTLVLEKGHAYRAVLEVSAAQAQALSQTRVFGFDYGTNRGVAVEALLRDELFPPDGIDPLPGLLRQLDELGPRLMEPGLSITIEVHDDDTGDLARKQLLSERRAARLGELVAQRFHVPPERIDAVGYGAAQPLVPNSGERNKWKNRRVVIIARRSGPAVQPRALPMPEAEQAARAGERLLTLRRDGSFTALVPRPAQGPLVLELSAADGRRSAAEVFLQPPPAAAAAPGELSGPAARPPQVWVKVDVDLKDRQATVHDRVVPLALLDTTASFADEGTAATAQRFALRAPPTTVGWRFVVTGPLEDVVHSVAGTGPPPAELRWEGTRRDGLPVLGRHCIRLLVWDRSGSLGLSDERCSVLGAEGLEAPTGLLSVVPPAVVQVNGRGLPALGEGRFSGQVAQQAPGVLLLDVRDAAGRRTVLRVPLPPLADAQPVTGQVEALHRAAPVAGGAAPAGGPAPAAQPSPGLAPQPVTAPQPGPAPQPVTAPQPGPAPQPMTAPQPVPDPLPAPGLRPVPDPSPAPGLRPTPDPLPAPARQPLPVQPPGAPVPGPAGPAVLPPPADLPPEAPEAPAAALPGPAHRLHLAGPDAAWPNSPGGRGSAGDAAVAEPEPLAYASFGGSELLEALAPRGEHRPTSAAAAELQVALPPQGLVLRQGRLRVTGSTAPMNTVEVNGLKVQVDDGRFDTWVDLPAGRSFLVIRTRDEQGNEGVLRWPVEVAAVQHFLLAVADGEVGDLRARLDGTPDPLLEGTRVYGAGRAALYYKGRIEGKLLFEKVFVTAHLDTARQREFSAFHRQVIDPRRSYAVYGDSSTEIVDADRRGKLYVLVEADESKALVGSFASGIQGIELARYDRTLDGELVDLQREWRPGWRTGVRAFHAAEDSRLRHGHDELRGTGGSLYYLRSRPVVEGSEQVRIVVRDRVNGLVLQERPLTRDVDYEMRYDAGRLMLRQPLSSVVDAGFLGGSLGNSRALLTGNPAYLVVDYEHRQGSDFGDATWGMQLSQELGGVLRLGGSMVREGRVSESGYELKSAELTLTPHAGTKLELEAASSKATDAWSGQSQDGGLTFAPLVSLPQPGAGPSEGKAYWARLQSDLGLLLGHEQRLPRVELHYKSVDAGYFANGGLLEQGTSGWGLQAAQSLGGRDELMLRHEQGRRELGLLAQASADPMATKGAPTDTQDRWTTLQLRHRGHGWLGQLQYDRLITDRTPEGLPGEEVVTHGVSGGLTWRVTRRLDLLVQQELTEGGDERLYTTTSERLVSSFGFSYALLDDLRIQALEQLRWNGENATLIGLHSRMKDDTDVYLQQRLSSRAGPDRFGSALVFGAQRTVGKDGDQQRSYSELQLEEGSSAPRSQALVGMGRRWTAAPGLALDVGFEHGRLFDALSGPLDHDSLSIGGDVTRWRSLKASVRYELRYQDQEEDLGGRDLRQLVALHRLLAKLDEDVTFHGRLDVSQTTDTSIDEIEARTLEAVVGLAYRPSAGDWFSLLVQYGHLLERSPGQRALDEVQETDADVFSATPVIDTPLGVQIIEKVAFRRSRERSFDLPETTADLLLLINRLNVRTWGGFEVAGEYRFRKLFRDNELEHGALGELAYVIGGRVRIAGGYNFTSFGDNEFALREHDAGGPFFRLTGQY